MNNGTWKRYAFWVILAEAVGGLSGWLSREGMKAYEATVAQPPLSPPMWVFPIVWGILFALMGIGAARISLTAPSAARSRGLNLFVLQLAVNFLWPLVFFAFGWYLAAFFVLLVLWVLVFLTIYAFADVDEKAGDLLLPYILWVTFAAYLNVGVYLLN